MGGKVLTYGGLAALGVLAYKASVLIVDEQNYMERTYLEELARQLGLDPSLKKELEDQVKQVLQ